MKTMRKKSFLILPLILLFCCCSSHIDATEAGTIINYGDFGFKINKSHNLFYSRVKIGMKADREVRYHEHFDIKVPKKIKKWLYSGTAFIMEFDNGQIVCIDAETEIEEEKITDWIEIPEDDDLLYKISNYYTSVHGKRWDYLVKTKSKRYTKIFNDGHSTIILFNIKKENLNEFITIKNSLVYIESKRNLL